MEGYGSEQPEKKVEELLDLKTEVASAAVRALQLTIPVNRFPLWFKDPDEFINGVRQTVLLSVQTTKKGLREEVTDAIMNKVKESSMTPEEKRNFLFKFNRHFKHSL